MLCDLLIAKDLFFFSRKRWFDNEHANTERGLKQSTKLTTDIELTIHQILPKIDQLFIDKYRVVFDAVPFTHLNIDYPTISKDMLVKMIHLLPNLHSLKLSSLRLIQSSRVELNLTKMRSPPYIDNKITKVCHENTTDREQVDYLLHLCLSMEHFQVHVSETIDLNCLLRLILTKVGTVVPRLRSLCLCVPNASEVITHQLRNLIESEGLLLNYVIKRSGNHIHLQWH